ncbi:MAG: DUF1501 domain-containing protein, partial [Planctomycetota bacterium]|nr:DUF1501 domain-containing protein [Planctomycetota bacterium]
RRSFLKGSLASAALPFFFDPRAAGGAQGPGPSPLLLVVFLRGGADGLGLLPPVGDPQLARLRPSLVPKGALAFGAAADGTEFALHPSLAPLLPYAESGALAAFPSVGLLQPVRSHFDAQDLCERGGAPADAPVPGWLARVLTATGATAPLQSVAAVPSRPLALSGDPAAMAFERIEDLRSPGRSRAASEALAWMTRPLPGERPDAPAARIARVARQALGAVDRVHHRAPRAASLSSGPDFPRGPLGTRFATVARLVEADLGLVAAWIDAEGYDTHVRQGAERGALANRLTELAGGLDGLARRLGHRFEDLLVLVVTEFGRTARPNGSGGTDHGRGGVALAMGGALATSGIASPWPGLEDAALADGRDVAVTTDLRAVLALGARHLGVTDADSIFPGWRGASEALQG